MCTSVPFLGNFPVCSKVKIAVSVNNALRSHCGRMIKRKEKCLKSLRMNHMCITSQTLGAAFFKQGFMIS